MLAIFGLKYFQQLTTILEYNQITSVSTIFTLCERAEMTHYGASFTSKVNRSKRFLVFTNFTFSKTVMLFTEHHNESWLVNVIFINTNLI